jgi:hypothetical protein
MRNLNLIISILALTICFVFISACNPRCFTVPGCWVAPGPTTKIWTNKYYEKHFIKTDTLLSTKYIYAMTDTINQEINDWHKYEIKTFLFYTNGLVLEENYNGFIPDTLHTYTQDLKYACCHAWTIGSYKVSNDTISFATKSGEMKYWQYYKAKMFDDSIQVLEEITGDKKDYSLKKFQKRVDKTIIEDIKFR